MKKYAIMMVGKTHSGKTTFGQELEKDINGVVLQTDPIGLFLKREYLVDLDKDKEHDGSFKEPSLKIKIYNTIFEHILKKGNFIPILANSNMHQQLRDNTISQLRENNFRVIGVYMNFSDDILLKRIKEANKSAEVLSSSKNFETLLDKQRDIFIEPKESELDYFFEITSEQQIEEAKKEIAHIVKVQN